MTMPSWYFAPPGAITGDSAKPEKPKEPIKLKQPPPVKNPCQFCGWESVDDHMCIQMADAISLDVAMGGRFPYDVVARAREMRAAPVRHARVIEQRRASSERHYAIHGDSFIGEDGRLRSGGKLYEDRGYGEGWEEVKP